MLLNCINSFGQTKLVVQSIMHMKIYGKTDKKKKRNEKKKQSVEQTCRKGKLSLLTVTWMPMPQTVEYFVKGIVGLHMH